MPKRKVGFAEEIIISDSEEKKAPKEASEYLPENKPKPILKTDSSYDQPLQGLSSHTFTKIYLF